MDIAKILKDIDLRMTAIGHNSVLRCFMPTEIWRSDPRIRLNYISFYAGKPHYCTIVASNKVGFEAQSIGTIKTESLFRYLKVE